MLFKSDIKNCRIIVYSENSQKPLADTIIKRFNSNTDIAIVDGSYFKSKESQRISALIFGKESLFECMGTLRPTLAGSECEVCFFKKSEKNDRGATRYEVNMLGNVISVHKALTDETLDEVFPAEVVNMSATGLLLSVPSKRLAVDDTALISAFKDGHRLRIQVTVVRLHSANVQQERFGCKIQSVQSQ